MTAARVLICEDDPAIRRLLQIIARRAGSNVEAVADGADAIALLDQNRYDLLLIDLMMPRVNGYELIERIARLPRPRPLVVVVTAALHASFDPEVVTAVIRKPFENALMASVLADVAGKLAAAGESPHLPEARA